MRVVANVFKVPLGDGGSDIVWYLVNGKSGSFGDWIAGRDIDSNENPWIYGWIAQHPKEKLMETGWVRYAVLKLLYWKSIRRLDPKEISRAKEYHSMENHREHN